MWVRAAAQSKRLDQVAHDRFHIATIDLMERAALALLEATRDMTGASGHILVVCGKGNNCGDGVALARLAKLAGYEVTCVLPYSDGELSELCRVQVQLAARAGVTVNRSLISLSFNPDLAVDALLGVGAVGAPDDRVAEAIRYLKGFGSPILSCDLPSGIEADTGRAHGEFVSATRTVTFGSPKLCMFQRDGLVACGDWRVSEIGFPAELLSEPTEHQLLESAWVRTKLPFRARDSHKHKNGRVLIIAGSDGMTGAAVLAAMGAIRAGAGLVTVAGCDEVRRAVQSAIPEVLTRPVEELADSLESYDACVIGPGLGRSAETGAFLADLVARLSIPTCLDADALFHLGSIISSVSAPLAITPHEGELARLLGEPSRTVQENRFESVALAAERLGVSVLLKGPYSLIATQGQPTSINPTGNPGMATGGMGDVLSGLVGTCLAQGLSPHDSLCVGAYLHGLAADLCLQEIGEVGFTASDVATRVPQARATL